MWLVSLMTRKPLGAMRLGPEDLITIELANRLRVAVLEGRLRGTWTKIPHEVGAVSKKGGQFRVASARYAKQIAMGLITGSADFVFVWDTGGGWIELKSKTGTLSPTQKDFRSWAQAEHARHEVAKSADEAEEILRGWGVLT